jgi:glycosyltransferase involved in cell wall biosynthesis
LYFEKCKGLSNDVEILNTYLHNLGSLLNFKVVTQHIGVDSEIIDYQFNPQDDSFYYPLKFQPDIVIHIQNIIKDNSSALDNSFHILIPNPEWTQKNTVSRISEMNLILHKTHYSFAIFQKIFEGLTHVKHFYLGFTTLENTSFRVKNFTQISHFRGPGVARNTDKIFQVWNKRQDLPLLRVKFHSSDRSLAFLSTIGWIRKNNIEFKYGFTTDEEYFQDLSESGGIHLCTSEMEGFGHYINESRMIGAVPVVTNGFPMSELVDNNSGFLIQPSATEKMGFGVRFKITLEDLENTIDDILHEPPSVLEEKGRNARHRYEIDQLNFILNLRTIVEDIRLQLGLK